MDSYLPELITVIDNRRVKVAFILYFLKIDASYLPAKFKFCESLCYFYSILISDWQGKPHPKDVMCLRTTRPDTRNDRGERSEA